LASDKQVVGATHRDVLAGAAPIKENGWGVTKNLIGAFRDKRKG
jgi:hypothetical protein